MKLNAFAGLSFLICFLFAVPPIVSASDNTEVFVTVLDSRGVSNYMESLGEGQFTPQEFLNRVSGYSYGNGIGDFDNDGDLDYIIGSGYNSGSIYLFEKLGPGNHFNSALAVGIWDEGNLPMDIAVADFNEDGNLDFILTQYNTIDCVLFTGDGEFGFTRSLIPDSAPEYSIGADAADFNNDGHVDFVAAPYMSYDDSEYFYVNLGKGDGTFTTIEVRTYEHTTYWGVAAGDFDGDGIADLVATSQGIIDVYLGVGDGTFDWGHLIKDPGVYRYAPVDNYDFNGDQIQDIVIGRYGTKQGVGVLLGDGEGKFIHSNTYFGGSLDDRYAIAAPPYVQNKSPVAVIDPAYQEITAGETIFFDGEGSYDEDGEVVSYTWSFAEQSLSKTQISGAQSLNEGFSAQHVFYQAGLYTITLTVTDDKGATDSVEAQVRVKPLEVKIRFTPHTLNLKSRGKWVQATIWLPKGYDISQIDYNSLCIVENQTPVAYAYVDHKWKKFKKRLKKKGVRKLKVKFDRQALLAALSGPAGVKTLHVQGRLHVQSKLSQGNAGSINFEGAGKIRTIEPRIKQKLDKKAKVGKKDKPHKEDKKLQKFLKKLARWLSLHR